MKRETLLKYTNRQLLNRIIRLARMTAVNDLENRKDKKTEIELNNVAGIIEDRLLGLFLFHYRDCLRIK